MKIGFIGTGLMGYPMAERVLAANYAVTAYNRTSEKVAGLVTIGATIANDTASLCKDCEAIILMLSDAKAIEEQLMHENILSLLPNHTIIQMGTIAPRESLQFAERIKAAGGNYIEAPVLGSIPEAKNGKLMVMVGSSKDEFNQWLPLLRCFGDQPLRIGEVGTASTLKLALNQLIASLTSSFCLSLALIEQSGVDVEIFMQILRNSALYAPTFDKKLNKYLNRDYASANFPTKHLAKDVNLFLQQTASTNIDSRMLKAVAELLNKAISEGLANSDYSSIYQAVSPK